MLPILLKKNYNAADFILFPEPKDPPKNVVISIIPEEVTQVKVTFTPPEEPNGNITAYFVYIFEKDKLVKNVSLNITERDQNTMTAVIDGLKGGHSYSIQVDESGQIHRLTCAFQNISVLFCASTSVCALYPLLHWSVYRFLQRMVPVEAHPAHMSR